ncbi:MAG: hypothetical protein Q8O57_07700 [Kiritimatiellota bacterium]|nr:hypothetical protein [Kiritimatiellota bacterium]
MDGKMSRMGVAGALLAFVFCLGGGLWILSKTGLAHGNDAVSTGIGLYFVGKAFFVGPMLLITALKSNR